MHRTCPPSGVKASNANTSPRCGAGHCALGLFRRVAEASCDSRSGRRSRYVDGVAFLLTDWLGCPAGRSECDTYYRKFLCSPCRSGWPRAHRRCPTRERSPLRRMKCTMSNTTLIYPSSRGTPAVRTPRPQGRTVRMTTFAKNAAPLAWALA